MLPTLDNGKCDTRSSAYDIIYTIYILMAFGIVFLLSLSICGILMTKNLKQLASRVQPTATLETGGTVLRRRDRDMMKMLLKPIVLFLLFFIHQ